MLAKIRAFFRLTAFFIITLLTVILVGAGNVLLGVFSSKATVAWKNKLIRLWAWSTAKIIGLTIHLEGTPPEPPFILVANHLSYIDVVPLWRYLDATFIAKSEIKSWPFFGWGTRTLGVLFINRELKKDIRRVNKLIASSITDKQGLIIFPEGTSTKGADVLPFNAPLLQYPAENEIPVKYASLTYRTRSDDHPPHLKVCWWGDMPFFGHFWELLKMSAFEADLTFGDSEITETDRKVLAQKLHASVISVFSPTVEKNDLHASPRVSFKSDSQS